MKSKINLLSIIILMVCAADAFATNFSLIKEFQLITQWVKINSQLNEYVSYYGSSASMVNGALDGFVKSAALEMPRNIRINVVSPTVLTESMGKYADYFRGFVSVQASQVALAYSKSVEGAQTGQIYRVGYAGQL